MPDHDEEYLSTELIDHAISALNEGDRARAITLSERALAIDPRSQEALDLRRVPAGVAEVHRSTVVYTILITNWNPPLNSGFETLTSEIIRQDLERLAYSEAFRTLGGNAAAYGGRPHSYRQENFSRWFEFRADDKGVDDILDAVDLAHEAVSSAIAKVNRLTSFMYGCTFTVSIGISRGIIYYMSREGESYDNLLRPSLGVFGNTVNEAADLAAKAGINSIAMSESISRLLDRDNVLDDPASLDTRLRLSDPPWTYDRTEIVIDRLQQQLDTFIPNSQDYARTACTLAGAYIVRYLGNSDESLLARADELLSRLLKNAGTADISDKVRATIVINYAQLVIARYQAGLADTSALMFAQSSIERIYDALQWSTTRFNPADVAPILSSLGTLNLLLYENLEEPYLLDKAIAHLSSVGKLGLRDDNTSSLSNLANALVTRYERSGRSEDLETAIDHYAVALPMTGPTDPQRAGLLSNFATALRLRGQQPDIERAVDLLRAALEAAGSDGFARQTVESNIRLTAALAASGDEYGAT